MVALERIYTIPLALAYETVRTKRGKRAITLIRKFALRHMKAEEVKISEGVNSAVLRDGIQKPPRRIKVRIVKSDDGVAKVWLLGEEEKVKEIAEKKKKDEEAAKKKPGKKEEAKPVPKPAASSAKPVEPAPAPVAKPAAPKTAKPASPAPTPPANPASLAQAPAAKK